MENPSSSNSTNLIIGIVAAIAIALFCVCAIVPIAMIVIMALTGPAVGNVFSNIITSLPPTTIP